MHILATTDFSECAGFALDRAVSLTAANPNASLMVMHVRTTEGLEVVRQMFAAEVERMEHTLVADAEDRLTSLAQQCEAVLKRKVNTFLAHGRPEAEIVRAATRSTVDLIIIGERGRSPLPFPFLGGTAERVLQKTGSSVLAVKHRVVAPYRRVLVCVSSGDGAPTPNELAFLLARGADIILLNAFEVPFERKFRSAGATESWVADYRAQSRRAAEQDLAKSGSRLEAAGIQARRIAAPGPAAETILNYSHRLAADLVVVGKHEGSILGNFFFDDIARQVVVESKADVLVTAPARTEPQSPADV